MENNPIEDDPAYKAIFEAVDRETEAALADDPDKGEHGFCHTFWAVKKQILREKYGIEWKTPQEMEPDTLFD